MKINWRNQIIRTSHRDMADNTVSAGRGWIRMSKNLLPNVEGYDYFEVFVTQSIIGLSPSNDKVKGFKIRKRDVRIPEKYLKIEKGRYLAVWDAEEEKIIIDTKNKL